MPEYLAPGVFVEEVSFRSKSIEGVGTSVAAIAGPTRTGPLRGMPEVVTSFSEFTRMYGDVSDLSLGGTPVLNYTALAAKAFFDGGGKQLFVARVANYTNPTDGFASVADSNGHVTFSSRFPGAMGNVTLEIDWRDSENLLLSVVTSAPADGEIVFIDASGLGEDATASDTSAQALPLSIRGLVRKSGTSYEIVDGLCQITDDNGASVTPATLLDGGNHLLEAGLVNDSDTSVTFTKVQARRPASGALADGTSAVLNFSAETDLSAFFTGTHWGTLTTLRGTLNAAGTVFTVDASGLNPGVTTAISLNLSALAAASGSIRTMMVQRSFDINVRNGGAEGPVIYTYADISTAPSGSNSLSTRLAESPAKRYDALTSPVQCELADSITGANIITALYDLFDAGAMSPAPMSVDGPRYLITLTGGNDGNTPAAVHYGGEINEVTGSTGFAAFEDIEDISIVMCPAASADATNHQAVVAEMQKHCRKMRYRVGIVDSRQGMSLSEIREFRSNFDDSRLALYYPWVTAADPRGTLPSVALPPAGFIAGVYANTDVQRGVHKAPANEPVIGALGFAQEINRFQQELLNPAGVNCLRSFPGRGHRVWGGRTLSSDPEWKYVNVRRYFLYLERSIEKSTQWVVFEPNGERLWDNVRITIENFLYNEWANGRLLGSAKTAYFVRCDRSTMTQNDLDNGRLVCEVGVAALTPAEFVIFRIGQKTADS
ncbi:phage tail sheath subtilisin-like domain-containing protein [uncultured Thalassolituus sp.]|uniref:phage tail sheath subtilisin-like domain-containing protein n=1 Tax=uncultured Thalassolituus sp. TaxID=285273 RepID=UPI00260E717C|nr:phage tail sheath subtilisin-like domain-containing protein [uncultured Thalassolituus sp.]